MPEHVYRLTEIVGSSRTTIEDAVNNALAKAATMVENLRWFVITETRGQVENGRVGYWQVTLKVGSTLGA